MPPRPNTTTFAPGPLAVLITAPMPVVTPQPIAYLVEGRVFTDLASAIWNHRVVGEGRCPCSDAVSSGHREAASAVGHEALALRHTDGLHRLVLRPRVLALAAFGNVQG